MAKNVLICDDAAFMRMMIKDILSKNGYNVAGEAENGAKAVEKYNELKPDLVLMDIQMPVMSGYEAAEALRASSHARAKQIPVIAMTANAFAEDIAKALSSGMNAHIAKPVDINRLESVLTEFLNKND